MFPGLRARPLLKNFAAAREALAPVLGNSGSPSFRNRIANGNFSLNQRVVVGTVILTAGVYGHDRWKAGAGGCTYTFATNGLDTVITILSGTLLQIVPAAKVEGGAYVASWAGTASGRIGTGPFGASGLVATGVLAAVNLPLEFGVGTLGLVQLSPGTVATPFERVDPDLELVKCRRFYHRNSTATQTAIATGLAFSATSAAFVVPLPAMRASPALISVNLFITNGGGSVLTPSSSSIAVGTDSVLVQINVGAGLSVGQASILYAGNGAGGYIAFDSEL